MKRVDGNALDLYAERDVTERYYACRIFPDEYNHTSNPTIISQSTYSMIHPTPNLINEFLSGSDGADPQGTMTGNPHTYINGVGLWNKNNQLIAIASLSTPIKKNFEREVIIKVKLSM